MRPAKPFEQIRRAIQQSMSRSGAGARTLEAKLGLKPWSLRGILDRRRPQVPSVDRAAEICKALGLEFYIGPPREPGRGAQAASSDGTEDEAQKLLDILKSVADRLGDLQDYVEVPVYSEEITGFSPQLNRAMECTFPYRTRWLERYGVDPRRCFMARLRGEQMDPTLPDKSFVLVNEAATELREGGIFVVSHRARIMVRRAEKSPNAWWLKNDGKPRWKQRWTAGGQVFGEVVWMARHMWMPRLEEPAATTHEIVRPPTIISDHPPLHMHGPQAGEKKPT